MSDTGRITLQLENNTNENGSLISLSNEEVAYAEEFARTIDITNITQIIQYGSLAQKHMTDFSDSSLRALPSKDLDVVAKELNSLIQKLKEFETDFDHIRYTGVSFNTLYDRIEREIIETQRRMDMHHDSLLRHVKQLEGAFDKVMTNIKEFDLYILAGKSCLKKCREEDLPALKNNHSASPLLAFTITDYEEAMIRMEKKIEALELSRQIPLTTLSQIRVIQKNDALMADNLNTLNANIFPLWKERMTLSMGLKGAGASVDSTIFHDTNKLLIDSLSRLIKIQNNALEEREKMLYVINS